MGEMEYEAHEAKRKSRKLPRTKVEQQDSTEFERRSEEWQRGPEQDDEQQLPRRRAGESWAEFVQRCADERKQRRKVHRGGGGDA